MHRLRRQSAVGIAALAAAISLLWSAAAAAQTVPQARRLLDTWQFDRASKVIDSLASDKPDSPQVQYLRAREDFLHGRYDRALERLDQLETNGFGGDRHARFRKLVESTRTVTENYEKHVSPQGRFEIYVEPGKDRVLVPYAARALERAYDAIGKALDHRPDTPIRVEVYPSTATLAKVSGLTEEEIRTSGTIALAKYNRLMITSPKALLKGYGWADTLIHEYIHLVINRKMETQVPIWMHEGLAKYLEHRWRGPDVHHMTPSMRRLLDKRLKKDDLVSFEQMHPSMAKLPSQEDAGTAFAQVYTLMEYLHRQQGDGVFVDLLDAVSRTGDARRAVEVITGNDFSTVTSRWKAYLRETLDSNLPEGAKFEHGLVFKDQSKEKMKPETFDKPRAKDHMKLGEMLQARERFEAATVEYEKATRLAEAPNPRLSSRFAHVLNETGQHERAIEVLSEARSLYPDYVAIWLELGEANLEAGRPKRARKHLLEAVRINPFNPEVHELLARVYEKLGDTDRAKREKKFVDLVE
ncbi:MAG: tetratricopeptide repeat protein [Bradymonadaceae bacterium]